VGDVVEARAQYIHKNVRYRILTINNENYIVNLGRPFLVFLFPFIYWLYPQTVYKLNDELMFKKLKAPEIKNSMFNLSILGAGISVLLANALGYVIQYFEFQTPNFVNIMLLLILFLAVFALRYRLSNKSRDNLNSFLQIAYLDSEKVWVRPQSMKHFGFVLIYFLLFLILVVACFAIFLVYKNFMFYIFSTMMLFLMLIANGLTIIPGKINVRFESKKRAL
jgi:uncharacterized membrane protein (TIGR01218 family)